MANKRDLLRLHKRLCKELGIPVAQIQFRPLMLGYTGVFLHNSKSIWVDLEACKDQVMDPREVIAHETFHHYQVFKGWLRFNVSWRGEDFRKHFEKPYNKQPWEIGAFSYQGRIANREGWRNETKSKQKA